MEINIKNAFSVAVKLSWGPFLKRSRLLATTLEDLSYHFIFFLLRRPLLSTILVTNLILVIMIHLSYASVVLIGVMFTLILTLIIEGYIIVSFFVTVSVFIFIFGAILILIFVIRNKIYAKDI